MYTQCPECGTVFRVTAAVLRAAQGQVRCGVCDASFDALRFLSDDVETEGEDAPASRAPGGAGREAKRGAEPAARDFGAATRHRPSADEERALGEIAAALARGARPGGAVEPPAPPPAAPAAPAPPAPEAIDVNVLEPTDVEDIVLGEEPAEDIPDAALEFDLPAEGWEQVFVKESGPAVMTPLDIDLERPPPPADSAAETPDELVLLEEPGDALARTDEYAIPDFELEIEHSGPAPAASAEIELEPAEVGEIEHRAEPSPAHEHAGGAAHAPSTPHPESPEWTPIPIADAEPAFAPGGAAAPAESRLVRAGLLAGAVALVVLLAAQAVHYFRDALADSPLAGPALAALYARLGLPLEPHWDLAAYDVRQWGAQSEDMAGVLKLRASIVNRANRGQPYPLLRVTLEDRFGARVGRREFAPAEYLPGRAAPRELLGPGARADAELSLADPGNQAVGFELDVCLMRRGALACGSDAKAGGG